MTTTDAPPSPAWRVASWRPWFAWAFGVAAPVVCLRFDPVVFDASFVGKGLLAGVRYPAYFCIGLSIAAMALWLLAGARLPRLRPLLAGLLAAGAVFSALLALVLTPFALAGVVLGGLGLLGLTPWLTAVAFLQQSRRALGPRPTVRMFLPLAAGFCAVVFSSAGVLVYERYLTLRFLRIATTTDAAAVTAFAEGAPPGGRMVSEALLRAFARADRGDRAEDRETLGAAYRALTGRDARDELWLRSD